VLKFILQVLYQSTEHIYDKKKESGSVHLTNGSGSWRPKNMRILLIRIPNTGAQEFHSREEINRFLITASVNLGEYEAVPLIKLARTYFIANKNLGRNAAACSNMCKFATTPHQ
jgi:hypothetical protein